MGHIRINELARELEVKPSIILEMLPELGVLEKKTHSSSLEDHIARVIWDRLSENSKKFDAMPLRPKIVGPLAPATQAAASATPISNTPRKAAEQTHETIPEPDLPIVDSSEAGRSFCLQRYKIAEFAKNAQKEFKKLPEAAPPEWQVAVESYSLVVMYGLLHGLLERVGIPITQSERFLGRKPALTEHFRALLEYNGASASEAEAEFFFAAYVRNRIAHPWETGQPSLKEVRRAKLHLKKYLLQFVEDAIDWVELTNGQELEDPAASFYHYVSLVRVLDS